MKRKMNSIYTITTTLLFTCIFLNFSSSPPVGKTDAPGDGLCTDCHSGGNPNGFSGNIAIDGLPSSIDPNTTYSITVTTTEMGGSPNRAGFQLVALDGSDTNVGSISNLGGNTGTTTSGGRTYVGHSPAEFFGGGSDVVWTFDWTSPASPDGENITMYAASIIANGGGSGGDLTITNTVSGTLMAPSDPLMVSITSQTDVTCFGGSDGALTANAVDGDPPYVNYAWSNGDSGFSISGLPAGSYTVTVTDNIGSTATVSTTITEPSAVTTTITGPNMLCTGESITLDAGSGFSNYNWDTGDNTRTTIVTSGGTYCVTVTDGDGCTGTDCIVVIENAPTIPTITGSTSLCTGESIILDAGAGFVSYNWDGQPPTQMISVTAGTYCVTVTDANGCTGTDCETVTENTPPSPTIISGLSFCTGLNTDLDAGFGFANYNWDTGDNSQTINVSVGGTYCVTVTDGNGCTGTDCETVIENALPTPTISGSANFCTGGNTTLDAGVFSSYLWSPGGETSQTINVTSAGTYIVTVTDGNGCTGTDEVTVTESTGLDPTITGNLSFCTGSNTTLDAGNFSTYLWFPGNETTQTIAVSTAGTYIVTVTDDSGCTGTNQVTVTESTGLEPTITGATSFCTGGSTTLDAGAEFSTYSWSPGGETTQTISVTSAGTYSVTVTDASNCTGTDQVAVTEGASLNPTLQSVATLCTGGNATLSVNETFANYIWTTGDTTQSIVVTTGGFYSVTVSDGDGCTGSRGTFVNTTPPPAVDAGSDGLLDCTNTVATLDGSNSESGTNISYQWTASNGGNIVSGATTTNPVVNAAGTYTLVVTDSSTGCTASDNALVTSDASLPTANAGADGTLDCNNTILTLDGSGSSSGTDIIYQWTASNGGNIVSGNTTTNPIVDSVGTYTLVLTDTITGCTASSVTNVIFGTAAPTANAGTDGVLDCNNTILTLDGSGSSSGTEIIYEWTASNGGNIISGDSTTNPVINAAGTYTLVVTDTVSSCSATDFVVTVRDSLAPFAFAGIDTFLNCHNSTVVLDGTVPDTNATVIYLWQAIDTLGSILSGESTPMPTIDTAGTFILTITDTINGCVSTDTIVVVQRTAVVLNITNQTNIDCNGNNNGSLSVNASGGMPPYAYLWSTGETGETISGLAPGEYSVTATDADSCTATTTLMITEPEVLMANATATSETSTGANDGTATATPSGGTVPYTYLWSNDSTTQSINGLVPDIYTVTVTDTSGCSVVENVNVSSFDCNISVTIDQGNVSCYGETNGFATAVVQDGTAPLSYTWSIDDLTTETIDGLAPGTYSVTVLDGDNCPATATAIITAPDTLTVMTTATDETVMGANDGTATANPNGGTMPYTYVWSNGDTTQTIIDLSPGTYTVSVTDANGCLSTAAVIINEGTMVDCSTFSTTISPTPATCYNATDGTAQAISSGGTLPYSYIWSTGDTTASISGLSSGLYTLTATDDNGCISETTAFINAPTAITITVIEIIDETNGNQNGGVFVEVSGSTPSYSFTWDKEGIFISNQQNLTNVSAGVYTLQVVDSIGCTATIIVEVDMTTATEEFDLSQNIWLSPNPTQDVIFLHTDSPSIKFNNINIYNISGQGLQNIYLDDKVSTISVDFSNYAQGIYFMGITTTDNKSVIKKVVVVR